MQVAEQVKKAINRGKDVYIYQLGDHDPSGLDAWRSFEERVRGFVAQQTIMADPNLITFERLAVTPEQITSMSPPTRPTKGSDTSGQVR